MVESKLADIRDFLAQKRIAIVGVSRNPRDFNTALFRQFRKRGYDALPVNPRAKEVDGQRCYECLQQIDPPVDAALLLTPADVTATVANDCVEAGIKRVWMYRAGGPGAVNQAGVELCRKSGACVIPGHCPLMFLPGTAFFHRLHGGIMKLLGQYPK